MVSCYIENAASFQGLSKKKKQQIMKTRRGNAITRLFLAKNGQEIAVCFSIRRSRSKLPTFAMSSHCLYDGIVILFYSRKTYPHEIDTAYHIYKRAGNPYTPYFQHENKLHEKWHRKPRSLKCSRYRQFIHWIKFSLSWEMQSKRVKKKKMMW